MRQELGVKVPLSATGFEFFGVGITEYLCFGREQAFSLCLYNSNCPAKPDSFTPNL